ncbi:flavin reductase family protein [Fluoribacter dumoffii]|uniref:Flavoredoxin n=1 Tax=Fluoribacter dumoffii TaxID=463 RepID=A0A377G792_9GAMM|nr:flavin reductase family protein [Fluoribacter dumoffii]KTC89586.1 Flavoredoxin [Fluoribacter dumoffii NY 23]MCW8384779.1 flavin reductase family protein [Fluoribacter dumoffii]MCW8417842.1 flavin reductase family protein [Fluoribacter dumoffii]MCW8454316.1 flavin reductase family protein [Fluoribacter dumoffii]MCW8461610.1 flavin reductase family protein [Fluoribacter dumoffii]
MKKQPYSLAEVYHLLEPGPVVLLSTSLKEKKNIMAMSWHTMMEFVPPIIGCVISENNYSFHLLKTSRECVINIPTVNLIEQVVACGNTSGKEIDKFKTFHLTPAASSQVHAPSIDECSAHLECKVTDSQLMKKYNFFILEVVEAWISQTDEYLQTIHHLGKGMFMVPGKIIKTQSKMK